MGIIISIHLLIQLFITYPILIRLLIRSLSSSFINDSESTNGHSPLGRFNGQTSSSFKDVAFYCCSTTNNEPLCLTGHQFIVSARCPLLKDAIARKREANRGRSVSTNGSISSTTSLEEAPQELQNETKPLQSEKAELINQPSIQIHLTEQNISVEAFAAFLHLLYTDLFPFEVQQTEVIASVRDLCQLYGKQREFQICQHLLDAANVEKPIESTFIQVLY